MKERRQKKILELIRNHTVTTQEELQSLLENSGFCTTQATISRDLRELRLVKVLSPGGVYYYTKPSAPRPDAISLKADSAFIRSIRSADHVGSMVVIRTFPAMASAVCEAIDTDNRSEIMGTVAGDNTIFVLLKTERFAEEFCRHIHELLRKKPDPSA